MRRHIALLLWSCAAPLSAQAPDQRAAVEALRDSLALLTDTTALKRLEARGIERARANRDNPFLHVRLGFIAYRLGELTGSDRRYEDAAGEFEWAAELAPGWAYAWYGLGLAELAVGEHAVVAIENLRQQLGKDHLSKAAVAFGRAVQADPSFARATIDLANTALEQRIRPRLDVALNAVRLAAATEAGVRPDVQLARGRVERELGEADSALAAFGAYLRVGGDSALGLLELARTQFFARRTPAGRGTYYAAARLIAGPPALTLLRADLTWAATAEELAAFDSLRGAAERAAWLERFWERRDLAEARDAGERLAEHYRRWFYAKRNFRLVSRHRHYDITEVYRPDQREFDDRGVIYLRHGDPDERARFICPNDRECAPNESWLYRQVGGDLTFHFAARDDVQDYKLVESLADVLGFSRAVRAAGGGDSVIAGLYASRGRFGDVYRRVGDGAGTAGSLLARERHASRKSVAAGTTSDSYRRRFDQPLGLVTSDFVVGAEAAGAAAQDLHVVFAIPAGRLAPVAGGDGALYPLAFRLLVTDHAERLVAQLDTTRVFRASEALRGGTYLVGRLAVPLAPGSHRYRLLVATPDGSAGELVARDSLAVASLDGRSFAASDLVVGRDGSGLRWVRPLDTVLLNPLGRFPERSTAELYYEVYGLEPGAAYHTVVRLEKEGRGSIFAAVGRLFGGGRAPVLLEFDAAAEGPVTRVHRSLDLRETPPGRYRLTVELRDPASGRTVVRSRPFEVAPAP